MLQKQTTYNGFFNTLLLLVMFLPLHLAAQTGPKAGFTQDKTVGCVPLIVNFTDASTGVIASYYWEFGNTNTSTQKNPSALYTVPGSYAVKLFVTSSTGQKDSLVKTVAVTVYANPIAAFSANPKALCENEKVVFKDISTPTSNPIVSWAWNFGDGSQSAQANPENTYTTAGTYAVSLTVVDDKGCKNSINQTNFITVGTTPKIAFTSDVRGGCTVPQTINFTDKTAQQGGKTFTYLWSFGDGQTSTQQSPSHSYTKQGSFDVTLTVKDNAGCSNSFTAYNFISIGKTVANFDAAEKTGCVPFGVNFINNSQNIAGNASFKWSFGNGDVSTQKNPSYTYNTPGTYDVTLEITSPGGCNDKIIKKSFITVLPPPVIDFRSDDSVSCTIPAGYTFHAYTVNAVKWEWDFGDSSTSNQENAKKTYFGTGTFTVSLTATFSNGCVVKQTKPNYIKNNTQRAFFEISDSNGCAPAKINFYNKSTAFLGIKKYEWDFKDGQTSTDENPTHTYAQKGKYFPTLTITDSAGCKSTYIYKSIQVGEKVPPNFIADPLKGCKQDMTNVTFTNLTDTKKAHVDTFIWIVGGKEEIIKSKDPLVVDYTKHIFKASPDSIDILLISVSGGCLDTLKKKNYIVLYPPDVEVAFTIDNCKLDTITFTNTSKGADKFKWWLKDNAYAGGKAEWWVADSMQMLDTVMFKKYLRPGNYTLIAKGSNNEKGCKDSSITKFKILNPLDATIGVIKKGICAGDSITFYSKGYNDNERYFLNYQWKVNGIEVASGIRASSFTYVFDDTTVFDVVLTITDAFGCVASDTAYDVGHKQKNPLGVVVTPDRGCFPLTSKLIYNAPPNLLKSAEWIINGQTINATGDTTHYIFNKYTNGMNTTGIYVTLEAKDTLGCAIHKTTKVFISSVSAGFATNTTLNCTNTELSFFNSSAALMPIGGLAFNWKLDDIPYSTSPSNKITYTQNSRKKIQLSIKDTVLGCTDMVEKTVDIVVKKMKAGFNVDNTEISCPPLISTFEDDSKVEYTTISSVLWSFGDGASSTLEKPVKSYFYPGNYDIVYTIFDAKGCADSIVIPGKMKVGGPIGTLSIDKEAGCAPLTVNFTSKTTIKKILWDLGDGIFSSGENATNTYKRAGTYQPYMVLEDTVGCVVFYPTKMPITVYPSPEPDFTVKGACLYDTFAFTNLTTNPAQTTFVWRFANSDTATGHNATYKFTKAGKYNVALEATSVNGCKTTAQTPIEIQPLVAAVDFSSKAACLGVSINAIDKSTTGAGIKSWQWLLGDGRTSQEPSPAVTYTTPGAYKISLIVQDNNGCYDSLLDGQTLIVHDTLPPLAPWAYRVTVEDNSVLRFEYSKYPGVDFGKYIIYRALAGQPLQVYKEILQEADTVFIDDKVTPSNFAYTYKVVNQSFCGFYSDEAQSRPHTSILLQGRPDTNKVHLLWSKYLGWDVVKSYHIYRKEPQGQTFIKIGTVAGTQTTFTDTNAYCGVKYNYYVMAEEDAVKAQFSQSNTINLAPIHTVTVLPGTMVRATVSDDKDVLIEFAAPTNLKAPIELYTIEKSLNGLQYQTLYTTPVCCLPYVDEKTEVHSQSYYYRVKCTDYCGDVSEPGNIGKSILLGAAINEDENVEIGWSAYQKWDDGVNHYELEMKNASGVYENPGINNITDTVYVDESGTYNSLAQVCYRVKAISNSGVVSYSNTDCVKGRSSLFVPNAFTPNKDGINTTFIIVGAYIKTYQLQIFNRYGELLYTSNNLEKSWDGTYKGEPVQDGAYLYVINAIGMDGKQHNPTGTVTLLR
jgi:gliding motility-associated-like protein